MHGEAFYRLGVLGVKVLILLGALFPSSVAPVSLQGFGVTELMFCLVLHPSHHLGFSDPICKGPNIPSENLKIRAK
jgi:hypothetical protein